MDTSIAPLQRQLSKRVALDARRFPPEGDLTGALVRVLADYGLSGSERVRRTSGPSYQAGVHPSETCRGDSFDPSRRSRRAYFSDVRRAGHEAAKFHAQHNTASMAAQHAACDLRFQSARSRHCLTLTGSLSARVTSGMLRSVDVTENSCRFNERTLLSMGD